MNFSSLKFLDSTAKEYRRAMILLFTVSPLFIFTVGPEAFLLEMKQPRWDFHAAYFCIIGETVEVVIFLFGKNNAWKAISIHSLTVPWNHNFLSSKDSIIS